MAINDQALSGFDSIPVTRKPMPPDVAMKTEGARSSLAQASTRAQDLHIDAGLGIDRPCRGECRWEDAISGRHGAFGVGCQYEDTDDTQGKFGIGRKYEGTDDIEEGLEPLEAWEGEDEEDGDDDEGRCDDDYYDD